MNPQQKITQVVIDRISKDTVTVDLGGKSFSLPVTCFPATIREGSVVSLTVSLDEAETKKRLENVQALKQELRNRSSKQA